MDDIHKPTLVLDGDKCRTNIRRMNRKAFNSNVVFRPHFKTHQNHTVGQWFREAGVEKITVSSLSMAKYFAQDHWQDILVAFPINMREAQLLNELAESIDLGITLSDDQSIELLNEKLKHKVSLYLKIDVGSHRTGFDPEQVELIQDVLDRLTSNPLISFKGFLAHAGHTYQTESLNEVHKIYNEGVQILKKLKAEFLRKYPDLILSWGDTPTCSLMSEFDDIDEIRPGNFVFYDLMQYHLASCDWPDLAAVVAAPIVASHPQRQEIVLYAGAVHLSKDFIKLNGEGEIFGELVRFTENGWERFQKPQYVDRLSQEHGIVKCHEDYFDEFVPGSLVGIIPVHACLTANLLKNEMFEIGSKTFI